MTDAVLASLIREVLAEELARLKPAARAAAPAEETVRVASDADLQAFARKVLALAADPAKRAAIEDGRLVFRLAGAGAASRPAAPATSAGPAATAMPAPSADGIVVIERGFVSERQIDRMSGDVRRVVLGKTVKLTPLARDRLRKRGIAIERMDQ